MKGVVMAVATLLAAAPGAGPAAAGPTSPAQARTETLVAALSDSWFKAEWRSFAARFVQPDGRVVDNGNGGISHSEGQGYGLVLAARAGDAERAEAIWRWTQTHLMVRKDALAAWRWDPAKGGAADTNNASDGDMLLAWGLWDAARRFKRPDYRRAATRIARRLGEAAVRPAAGGPVLLPGLQGFGEGEQPDGPVVNLSYWVFPAFAALKDLAPDTDWDGLRRHGLALLDASRFGAYGLPTDWETVAGPAPLPARGFPATFGYNAIRIPLYLALEGAGDAPARAALRRFAGAWGGTNEAAHLLAVRSAGIEVPVDAAGYDLVLAVARCATEGQPIAPEMINTRSDLYYPETLRLLSFLAIQERAPACL